MAVGYEDGVQVTDLLHVVRGLGVLCEEGSMMICSPPAVTNLNVACPRKVILAPPSICSTILLRRLTKHDQEKNVQMYTHPTNQRNSSHPSIILQASRPEPCVDTTNLRGYQ